MLVPGIKYQTQWLLSQYITIVKFTCVAQQKMLWSVFSLQGLYGVNAEMCLWKRGDGKPRRFLSDTSGSQAPTHTLTSSDTVREFHKAVSC